MVTYSEAGVDISLEEQTVKALTGELSETLDYRNIIKNKGHFAALVDFIEETAEHEYMFENDGEYSIEAVDAAGNVSERGYF